MPEYISKQTVLMQLMQDGCNAKNLQTIMDMPPAEVEPVVYCKDCVHSYTVFGRLICCYGCADYTVHDDFFCAYGVRR